MKRENVVKLEEITSDYLGINRNIVKEESSYYKDLDADSFDVANIIIEYEMCFNINIPYVFSKNILRIKDVIEYIDKNYKNKF
ncbi:acyl carrier protein [Fusobacterium sp. IOR10]|uniref:acyl carrier protein n=1 Tax=Fusobacterium sp. IOR10 TaxID=2665157 RepID=UPI0013D8B13B|nr:acyl carrier protein [Fusobacterium sp. IOR10]